MSFDVKIYRVPLTADWRWKMTKLFLGLWGIALPLVLKLKFAKEVSRAEKG